MAGFSWEFRVCSWISKNCNSFHIWIGASCLLRCAGQSGNAFHCWSDIWNAYTEFCTWDQAAHEQFLAAHFMSWNLQGGKLCLGLWPVCSPVHNTTLLGPWNQLLRKQEGICDPPQTAWKQSQGTQHHLVQQDHSVCLKIPADLCHSLNNECGVLVRCCSTPCESSFQLVIPKLNSLSIILHSERR